MPGLRPPYRPQIVRPLRRPPEVMAPPEPPSPNPMDAYPGAEEAQANLDNLTTGLENTIRASNDANRSEAALKAYHSAVSTPPAWQSAKDPAGLPLPPRSPTPEELKTHTDNISAIIEASRNILAGDPVALQEVMGFDPMPILGNPVFRDSGFILGNTTSWAQGLINAGHRAGLSVKDMTADAPLASQDPKALAQRLQAIATKILEADSTAAVGPPDALANVSPELRGGVRPVEFKEPLAPAQGEITLDDTPSIADLKNNPEQAVPIMRRILADQASGYRIPVATLTPRKPNELRDIDPASIEISVDESGRLMATTGDPTDMNGVVDMEVTESLEPLAVPQAADWKLDQRRFAPVSIRMDPETGRLYIDKAETNSRSLLRDFYRDKRIKEARAGAPNPETDPYDFLRELDQEPILFETNETYPANTERRLAKLDKISKFMRVIESKIPRLDRLAEIEALPDAPKYMIARQHAKLLQEATFVQGALELARSKILREQNQFLDRSLDTKGMPKAEREAEAIQRALDQIPDREADLDPGVQLDSRDLADEVMGDLTDATPRSPQGEPLGFSRLPFIEGPLEDLSSTEFSRVLRERSAKLDKIEKQFDEIETPSEEFHQRMVEAQDKFNAAENEEVRRDYLNANAQEMADRLRTLGLSHPHDQAVALQVLRAAHETGKVPQLLQELKSRVNPDEREIDLRTIAKLQEIVDSLGPKPAGPKGIDPSKPLNARQVQEKNFQEALAVAPELPTLADYPVKTVLMDPDGLIDVAILEEMSEFPELQGFNLDLTNASETIGLILRHLGDYGQARFGGIILSERLEGLFVRKEKHVFLNAPHSIADAIKTTNSWGIYYQSAGTKREQMIRDRGFSDEKANYLREFNINPAPAIRQGVSNLIGHLLHEHAHLKVRGEGEQHKRELEKITGIFYAHPLGRKLVEKLTQTLEAKDGATFKHLARLHTEAMVYRRTEHPVPSADTGGGKAKPERALTEVSTTGSTEQGLPSGGDVQRGDRPAVREGEVPNVQQPGPTRTGLDEGPRPNAGAPGQLERTEMFTDPALNVGPKAKPPSPLPEAWKQSDRTAEALIWSAGNQGWSKKGDLFLQLSPKQRSRDVLKRIKAGEMKHINHLRNMNPKQWKQTGNFPKHFGSWRPDKYDMQVLQEAWNIRMEEWKTAERVSTDLDKLDYSRIDKEIDLNDLMTVTQTTLDDWAENDVDKLDAWARQLHRMKDLAAETPDVDKNITDNLLELNEQYENTMSQRLQGGEHQTDPIDNPFTLEQDPHGLNRTLQASKSASRSVGAMMTWFARPYGELGPRKQAPYPEEMAKLSKSGDYEHSVYNIGWRAHLYQHQRTVKNINKFRTEYHAAVQNPKLDRALYTIDSQQIPVSEVDRLFGEFTYKPLVGKKVKIKLSELVPKLREHYEVELADFVESQRETTEMSIVTYQSDVLHIEDAIAQMETALVNSKRTARRTARGRFAKLNQLSHRLPPRERDSEWAAERLKDDPKYKRLQGVLKVSKKEYQDQVEFLEELNSEDAATPRPGEGYQGKMFRYTRKEVREQLLQPQSILSQTIPRKIKQNYLDQINRSENPYQSWAASFAVQTPTMARMTHMNPALVKLNRKLPQLPQHQQLYLREWMDRLRGTPTRADQQMGQIYTSLMMRSGLAERAMAPTRKGKATPEEMVQSAKQAGQISEHTPQKHMRNFAFGTYLSLLSIPDIAGLTVAEFGLLAQEALMKPVEVPNMLWWLGRGMSKAGWEGTKEFTAWVRSVSGTPKYLSEPTQMGVADIVHEAWVDQLALNAQYLDPNMNRLITRLQTFWFGPLRAAEYFLRASTYFYFKNRNMSYGMTETEAKEWSGQASSDFIGSFGPRDISPLAAGFPYNAWWPLNRFTFGKMDTLATRNRAAFGLASKDTISEADLKAQGALPAAPISKYKDEGGLEAWDIYPDRTPPYVFGSKHNFSRDPYGGEGELPLPEGSDGFDLLADMSKSPPKLGNTMPAGSASAQRKHLSALILLGLGIPYVIQMLIGEQLAKLTNDYIDINVYRRLNPHNFSGFSTLSTLHMLPALNDYISLSKKAMFGYLTMDETLALDKAKKALLFKIPMLGPTMGEVWDKAFRKSLGSGIPARNFAPPWLAMMIEKDLKMYKEYNQKRALGADPAIEEIRGGKAGPNQQPFGLDFLPEAMLPKLGDAAGNWIEAFFGPPDQVPVKPAPRRGF